MTTREQYQFETGDKEPANQLFYNEWYQRYMKWLDNKIETNTPKPC
jgi:hypothetical protein